MPNEFAGMDIDRAATIARNRWFENYIAPFSISYTNAFNKYKKQLEAEKGRHKQSAEQMAGLAILALTLCGGSFLSAAVGTASMKTALGARALKFVDGPLMDFAARKNSMTIYKIAEVAQGSEIFHYVLGGVYDHVVAQLGSGSKAKLSGALLVPTVEGIIRDPLNMKTQLQVYTSKLHTAILLSAEAIKKSSHKDKDALYEKLKKSPFFSNIPDVRKLGSDLERRIELSFWMTYIMSLDYQLMIGYHSGKDNPHPTFTKSPIHASPSSKNYAKPYEVPWARDEYGGGRSRLEVTGAMYDDTTSALGTYINVLHKQCFGTKFFEDEKASDKINRAALKKAEMTLKKIQEMQSKAVSGK